MNIKRTQKKKEEETLGGKKKNRIGGKTIPNTKLGANPKETPTKNGWGEQTKVPEKKKVQKGGSSTS